MQDQVTSKEHVLSALKRSVGRWTTGVVESDGSFRELRHLLDRLSPAIDALNSKVILHEWNEYNRRVKEMEKNLREAQAEIERIETRAMNVETYAMSMARLPVRRVLSSSLSHSLFQEYLHADPSDSLVQQTAHFSSQCNEHTSLQLREITDRLLERWKQVKARLEQLISADGVETWRLFNHSYVSFLDRLSELESRWFVIEHDRFTFTLDQLEEKAKVNLFSLSLSRSSPAEAWTLRLGVRRTSSTDRRGNERLSRTSSEIVCSASFDRREEDRHAISPDRRSIHAITSLAGETLPAMSRENDDDDDDDDDDDG